MNTVETILTKLKKYDDDNNFKFDEPSHTYTYGDATYTSVTTYLDKFHKPFDTEFHSKKTAKKLGIPQEEVLKLWKDKGDVSCDMGTEVHLWIENYYNKVLQEIPTNLESVKRINMFNILYVEKLHKLELIKCEQRIYSKKLKIAGMIDTLFLYKGNIIMLDWKTNGKMTSDVDCTYNKLLYPFNQYWENSLNKYSIQQSLYALILKEIGIEVKAMYLGYLPPDDINSGIHTDGVMYKCIDMRDDLSQYFEDEMNKEELRNYKIDDLLDGGL